MPASRTARVRAPLYNPYDQNAVPTHIPRPNPITHMAPIHVFPQVPESFVRTRVNPSHGNQSTRPSHDVASVFAATASRNTPEVDRIVARDLADKAKHNDLFGPSALKPNVQIPTRHHWLNYRREAAIQHALLKKERQLGHPLKTGSEEMTEFLSNLDHEAALSDLRNKAGNGFPHATPNTVTIHNTRDYYVETAVRGMHAKREHEIFDERGAEQKLWPDGDNTQTERKRKAALKKHGKQMTDLKKRLQAADAAEKEKLLQGERTNFDFPDDDMEILAAFAGKVKGDAVTKEDGRPSSVAAPVIQPRARRSSIRPRKRTQRMILQRNGQLEEGHAQSAVDDNQNEQEGLPVPSPTVEPTGVQPVNQEGKGSPRSCNEDKGKRKFLNSKYLDNNLSKVAQ